MAHLKSAIAAAASVVLGLAASSAGATTTNWGPHDPLEQAFVFYTGTGSQTISDEYTFSLGAGSVYDIGSSLLGGGLFSSTPMLTLYNSSNAVVFSAVLGSPTTYTLNLAAGSYKYTVSGSATGFFGYSLASSIVQATPVPEPETYAMMLAGLAAVGFLARRRQG